MKPPGNGAQDRNPARCRAAEGKQNGLHLPGPRRRRGSTAWMEGKFAC